MNYLLNKSMNVILSLLFFMSLLLVPQAYTEAQSCSVTDLNFSYINLHPQSTASSPKINDAVAVLSITTNGDCSDGLSIKAKAEDNNEGRKNIRIDGLQSLVVPDGNGIIEIKLQLEEAGCFNNNDSGSVNWGYECINTIQVLEGNDIIFDSKNDSYSEPQDTAGANIQDFLNKGVILGDCTTLNIAGIPLHYCGIPNASEDNQENWSFIEIIKGSILTNESCDIISASFLNFNSTNNIEDQLVTLKIETNDCENVPLELIIYEKDFSYDNKVDIKILNNEDTTEILNFIPTEDLISFSLRTHRDHCDTTSDPNCRFYIEIHKDNESIFSTEDNLDSNQTAVPENGVILANCGPLGCDPGLLTVINPVVGYVASEDESWKLITQPSGSLNLLTENDTANVVGISIEQNFDENNPCYENGSYREDCYELLAPLPQSEDSFFQTDPETQRQFVITTNLEVGDYVNQFFKIALGILMVMAVIMIIIAGVEYMTVESIYGKSQARTRITGAVIGLILALGIYLILNTINPRLLEVNFQPPGIAIQIQENQFIEGEQIEQVGTTFSAEGEVSTGLASILDDLQSGTAIEKITVTGSENATTGTAKITLVNGEESNTFPIGFGGSGLSSNWSSGNNNSPTGTFDLGNNRYARTEGSDAVLTYDGRFNMGPAFISIDQNPYVGVGIHGKAEGNSTATTAGCIRVRNEDLLTFMNNINPGESQIEIISN